MIGNWFLGNNNFHEIHFYLPTSHRLVDLPPNVVISFVMQEGNECLNGGVVFHYYKWFAERV